MSFGGRVSNDVAPEGHVFVCLACGKRSKDRYGNQPLQRGWDVSCALNSDMFPIEHLVMENGRVVSIKGEEDV